MEYHDREVEETLRLVHMFVSAVEIDSAPSPELVEHGHVLDEELLVHAMRCDKFALSECLRRLYDAFAELVCVIERRDTIHIQSTLEDASSLADAASLELYRRCTSPLINSFIFATLFA